MYNATTVVTPVEDGNPSSDPSKDGISSSKSHICFDEEDDNNGSDRESAKEDILVMSDGIAQADDLVESNDLAEKDDGTEGHDVVEDNDFVDRGDIAEDDDVAMSDVFAEAARAFEQLVENSRVEHIALSEGASPIEKDADAEKTTEPEDNAVEDQGLSEEENEPVEEDTVICEGEFVGQEQTHQACGNDRHDIDVFVAGACKSEGTSDAYGAAVATLRIGPSDPEFASIRLPYDSFGSFRSWVTTKRADVEAMLLALNWTLQRIEIMKQTCQKTKCGVSRIGPIEETLGGRRR